MKQAEKFDRVGFWKRGHFSNHFTLSPVQALEFSADGLTIVCRGKSTYYEYQDLTAQITDTFCSKNYGKAASSYMKQKLVNIVAPDQAYVFDLSSQFSDFKPQQRVLELIETNLSCTYDAETLKQVKRRHLKLSLAFFAVVLIGLLLWYVYDA